MMELRQFRPVEVHSAGRSGDPSSHQVYLMPNKMLLASVLLLLTACGDLTVRERQAAAAENPPIIERTGATEFEPDDSQQEWEDKAEARGAAQAQAAINGDSRAEERRRK